MSEVLHFNVSTGLKNIIGKELILNKYIAIFELVKNSYDAEAKNVKLIFKNKSTPNAKIIIKDDGIGMNKDDLVNKWLFVAYSAKKNPTYRDGIKRSYAGAKGIGRFSCDRLGGKVNILSKKEEECETHKLSINWNDFEVNFQDKFEKVEVLYDNTIISNDNHGTKIEISDLREEWSRSDLLELKRNLNKLINPNATNEYDSFTIEIVDEEELLEDEKKEETRDKVNGIIKNYIFETLNLKTTYINVALSKDGKYVTTNFFDRGIKLFKIKEKNIFQIKNIKCKLFFLNYSAKYNFTRQMGMEPVNYGSVFIYKNGFRVMPYGQPDFDIFNVNRRKAQGFKRYMGTRDLLGSIEITDSEDKFNETTSRDNGFIDNKYTQELEQLFMVYCLRPLEKYNKDIISWSDTDDIENDFLKYDIRNYESIIKKIRSDIKEDKIVSIEYSNELLEIIDARKEKAPDNIIKDIKQQAINTNNPALFETAQKLEKQTKDLQKQIQSVQKENDTAFSDLQKAETQMQIANNQIETLKNRADLKVDDALSVMHIMKTYADTICADINSLMQKSELKNLSSSIDKILSRIKQTSEKLISSYNIVTNTNYSAQSKIIIDNIFDFIKAYVNYNKTIKMAINSDGNEYITKFNPLEFTIIIDNIVSNSIKSNSNNLVVNLSKDDTYVYISFADDGCGLSANVPVKKMFEPGLSGTYGTGLGLLTIKKYIDKINGTVEYNNSYKKGFELIVRLKLWT